MWDQRPRRLRFARDGHLLVLCEPPRLRVVTVPAMDPVAAFEIDGLRDYVLLDEALWTVSGNPPVVSSRSLQGEPAGDEISLSAAETDAVQLDVAPGGRGTALCSAGAVIALRAEGHRLVAEPLEERCDLAIPIDFESRAVCTGDEVALISGRAPRWTTRLRIGSAGRAVAGSALFDGRTVAVLVEHAGQQSLQVLAARDGHVLHRIALRGITAIRFAPDRGYAFLRGGARTLIAIDLRFGKVLKEFEETRDVVDFSVDDSAHHLALVLRDTSGKDLAVYTTCREFLAAAEVGEIRHDSESPVVAEEDAAERDARSRSEVLASTRRARARSADDERAEPESDVPLELRELGALHPRAQEELCSRPQALELLNRHLGLVGSMCERAIAHGWDSGRIAFPDDGTFPFEKEVAGLLGQSIAAARERVAASDAAVEAAALALRESMQAIGSRVAPLRALMEEFELSLLAAEILIVIAAPVMWGEMARLYGILCNDPERAVCDEHLVGILLGGARERRHAIARELDLDRPLLRVGLVRVGSGKARPFLPLTVDPLVIRRLRLDPIDTVPGEIARLRHADRTLDQLVIPRSVVDRAMAALARPSREGGVRVVVRGRLGSGRRTLLAALAHAANRPLGVIDASLLPREPRGLIDGLREALSGCVIRGWLPCIERLHLDDVLEAAVRDQLRELIRIHAGPLAFRTDWDATPPIDPDYLQIDLPALTETQRGEVWTGAIQRHGLSVPDTEALAARFRAGPGIVERVITEVATALPERAPDASRDDSAALEAAMRRYMETRLGSVATRMTRLAGWSSVVLPADLVDSLLELISRIRHRRTVYEEWGFDRKMTTSRGLTVLFQGPPGTGKSMVAGVIAGELGLDLYRVDLSRIMSKWIGETERNLASVFDAAEDGQAVILFDEADSLFSKRTEVRTSVDRYANLEVNYLLQRLDSFEGIAILTTNFGGSIDKAFQRRMSQRLTFPFPDEEMREQLWRVHLPPELPTAGEFDLIGLAKRYRLSGGYIRNAALRAAFLAAEEKTPLTQDHLERAVRLEYRELGKLADTGILE